MNLMAVLACILLSPMLGHGLPLDMYNTGFPSTTLMVELATPIAKSPCWPL
jgi:hypothetical protein